MKFKSLSDEYDKYKSLNVKVEDKINSLNLKGNDKTDIYFNNSMIDDKDEFLNGTLNSKITTKDALHEMNSECNYKYDVLIAMLKDEIKFLRNELKLKDKIIELIVKELPVGNRRNVKKAIKQLSINIMMKQGLIILYR